MVRAAVRNLCSVAGFPGPTKKKRVHPNPIGCEGRRPCGRVNTTHTHTHTHTHAVTFTLRSEKQSERGKESSRILPEGFFRPILLSSAVRLLGGVATGEEQGMCNLRRREGTGEGEVIKYVFEINPNSI